MAALQEAKNRVASPFTVYAKTWSNRKDYRDLILLHWFGPFEMKGTQLFLKIASHQQTGVFEEVPIHVAQ